MAMVSLRHRFAAASQRIHPHTQSNSIISTLGDLSKSRCSSLGPRTLNEHKAQSRFQAAARSAAQKVHYDPEDYTDNPAAPSVAALPGSSSTASKRSGRPAKRSNPLGHSVLLSSYNARALKQVPELADMRLGILEQRTGYTFVHKEAAALALLHPSLAISGYGVSNLSCYHLAVLGEALLRYASVELAWSALQAATEYMQYLASAASAVPTASVPTASAPAASALASSPSAVTSNGSGAPSAPGSRLSAALLSRVAMAVATSTQLVADRWMLETHMAGFQLAPSAISKQDKVMCARALLATIFLDGGYAGALRRVVAPFVGEILQDVANPATGGSSNEDLRMVGRLIARLHNAGALPRASDDLDARPAAVQRGTGGLERQSRGNDEVEYVEGEQEAVDELVERLHGPPPYPRTSPAAHLAALLAGLRVHGAYQPQDVEAFLSLSDAWYGYLTACTTANLRGQPPPRGAALNARISDCAAQARAQFVLGQALYGVVVTELVLERYLGESVSTAEDGTAAAADKRQLRASVDRIRRERDRDLQSDRMRLAQMQQGLGWHATAAGRPGRQGMGGGEEWGEEYDGLGPVSVPGTDGQLARCADGLLAAVLLEGGLRQARAVARELVVVGEASELLQEIQNSLAEGCATGLDDS